MRSGNCFFSKRWAILIGMSDNIFPSIMSLCQSVKFLHSESFIFFTSGMLDSPSSLWCNSWVKWANRTSPLPKAKQTSFFVYPVNTLPSHCQFQTSKYMEFQTPLVVDQLSSTLHQSLYSESLLHVAETKKRWRRFFLECDLLHQYLISGLQLQKYHGVASFSLELKFFSKFSIPDLFVLVVASYHGLSFEVRHLYTMRIRVWFRLDRSTTKFLPRTNKIFDVHKNFAPRKNTLYGISSFIIQSNSGVSDRASLFNNCILVIFSIVLSQ